MTPDTNVSTIAFGQHREKGPVREENQDQISNFQSSVFGHLFLVADGMGGHEDGAIASNMAITGFKQHFQMLSKTLALREALAEAARLTNLDIYDKSEGAPGLRMGSTLVVCVISSNSYTVAHIGDSRCYSFRAGKLERLTKDHTAVQKLLDLGTISPEEARNHPDASVLTRALGQRSSVELEISQERSLAEDEALLLCSDGLFGYVDEELIADALQRNPDPQGAADALLDLALAAGGHDNISIYVVRVTAGVPRKETAPDPPVEDEAAAVPAPAPQAEAREHAPVARPGGRRRKLALSLLVIAAAIAAGPVTMYTRPDLVPPQVRSELSRFGIRLPDDPSASTPAAPPVRTTASNVPAARLAREADSTKNTTKDTAKNEPPGEPAVKDPVRVILAFPPTTNTGFLGGIDNMAARLRAAGYSVTKSIKPTRNGGVWEAVTKSPESFAPPRLNISAVFLSGYGKEAGNVCGVVMCTDPEPKQMRAGDEDMFERNFAGRAVFVFVHPAVVPGGAVEPKAPEKLLSQ